MVEKLIEFLKNNLPFVFIFLVTIILIIFPFMVRNNLEGFDMAGQVASVHYIREFFWPWPNGWNSMLLSGFPQGIIYPPFFHWLVATFSFILPLKLAFKVLLSVSILLFPIVYYFLGKSIFKNDLIAGSALGIAGAYYFFDIGLNDNLFSDLYFGMVPHLFSLTLFIAYLYFLHQLVTGKKRYYLASVLLALTVTTHVFTGLTAIIFGIVLLILSYFKDKKIFINVFKHLFLGALLSIWWWLPFIANLAYVSGSDISSRISPILVLVFPLMIIVNLIVFFNKKTDDVFIKTTCIFSILILSFYILGKAFPVVHFPIHFSRFMVYPVLVAPLVLFYSLREQSYNWKTVNVAVVFIFVFYYFFYRIIPVGPFDTPLLNKVEKFYTNGRAIVTGASNNIDDRYHITRMKLAMEKNIPSSEGLFVESTPNGWFIMSLMSSWENTLPTFVWAYVDLRDVINLKWATKIFGVNYEYRIGDKKPSLEDEEHVTRKNQMASTSQEIFLEEGKKFEEIYSYKEIEDLNFKLSRKKLHDDENVMKMLVQEGSPFYFQSFYQVGENALAETVSLPPVNIQSDWRSKTKEWWSTDWLASTSTGEYIKPLLIYNADITNWNFPETSKNLVLTEADKKMNEFTVNAKEFDKPVPIYVKVGYFPFWKAYDDQGNQLKIYKASPNFMMVYGNGLITFKFINPWYYYFGYIVSGVSLLLVILILVFKLKFTKLDNWLTKKIS